MKTALHTLRPDQSSLAVLQSANYFDFPLNAHAKLVGEGKVEVYKKLKTAYGHMTVVEGLQQPLELNCLCFDRTGDCVYSASQDGLVKCWCGMTGQLLNSAKCFHSVISLAVSPDNKLIAAGTNNGELRLWMREGLVKVCTLYLGNALVNDIKWWHIDSDLYITACSNTEIFIYSVSEIRERRSLAEFTSLNTPAEAVTLSVSSKGHLAVGLKSGEVSVWKARKEGRKLDASYLCSVQEDCKRTYFVQWSPTDSL